MSRVLVTGGTGRVGSNLVSALETAPETVRIASRDSAAARDRFGDGPAVVEFDFARPETWGPVLGGIDRLFLVYPPGVDVGRIREFIDAADRVGVERVAFLSILGAEKVPVLPHRRIERHLERSRPSATFLRSACFVQNLSGIHRPEIVERDELFVPAGDGALGFVDARDVAAVAGTVLTEPGHEGASYDLTGPTALDFFEVASIFSEVLERRIEYANPSRTAFVRRMAGRGVPWRLIGFMLAEYQVTRLGLSSRTTADVRRVLGRRPRSVRTFVEDRRDRFERADGAA
ncbi:SDR family oxidoreductase [Natrialbaceae archaeon GCM10025810]|uniref:SDR family oxidoreductase n=1 Tax=Halovalidus salilacus TaxID=3075124 RepID=UPI00362403C3